jgi:hypothetical protein
MTFTFRPEYAAIALLAFTLAISSCQAQSKKESLFRAIGFYTAKNDAAHISFVHEANKWFVTQAARNRFRYDSTNQWTNLNATFLAEYDVVIFLDTRPEDDIQRKAFEKFMKDGGAWMGFHFSAFALTPSAYPQNWDWYHQEFLGSGSYVSNTWKPTPAILRVEKKNHPSTKNLPATFQSAPNEWYRWENDLRENKSIEVLLSIDSTSFPLGTGPKPHEIWHRGYFPVAWRNTRYNMIYLNIGHNDVDYENKTKRTLSSSFSSETQNKVILDGLLWLGRSGKK